MADEKLEKMVKIATTLLERTRAGEIVWEETADKDTFLCSFPDYSARIARSRDDGWDESFELVIVDSKGRRLDSLSSGQGGADILPEMFELARRRALNVDEALGNFLETLTASSSHSSRS
jgi:hypothetical protein